MNNLAERQRFKQNAVDNQVQAQASAAISLLATSHINYLINAYSHKPADDQELKLLVDILNVQGADRDRVIRLAR